MLSRSFAPLISDGHGRPNVAGAIDAGKRPLEEAGVLEAVSYRIKYLCISSLDLFMKRGSRYSIKISAA
jgi:hypothetical protein